MENAAIERIWELISRKISNEASDAELQELQLLLQKNPQEAYSLEIMQGLCYTSDQHKTQYAEIRYKELIRKMQQMGIDTSSFHFEDVHIIESPSKKNLLTGFSLSAGIKLSVLAITIMALLVVTGIYVTGHSKLTTVAAVTKKSEITTKYGSKTTIVLPDGTKVSVNAGSKLSYDNTFGNTVREVYLTGEAFFDVVHNEEKPFIIHTAKMDIKDLGTAFNVRCYPDEKRAETSLIRGSIEITLKDRPKEKIYLKPEEKLTLVNDEVITTTKPVSKKIKTELIVAEPLVAISHITYEPGDHSVVETSWVENKLVFRGEPFEEVALKMEKWYGVKITITDDHLKKVHLTGSFDSETVEQALAALQLTTDFKYTNTKNYITITK